MLRHEGEEGETRFWANSPRRHDDKLRALWFYWGSTILGGAMPFTPTGIESRVIQLLRGCVSPVAKVPSRNGFAALGRPSTVLHSPGCPTAAAITAPPGD